MREQQKKQKNFLVNFKILKKRKKENPSKTKFVLSKKSRQFIKQMPATLPVMVRTKFYFFLSRFFFFLF